MPAVRRIGAKTRCDLEYATLIAQLTLTLDPQQRGRALVALLLGVEVGVLDGPASLSSWTSGRRPRRRSTDCRSPWERKSRDGEFDIAETAARERQRARRSV